MERDYSFKYQNESFIIHKEFTKDGKGILEELSQGTTFGEKWNETRKVFVLDRRTEWQEGDDIKTKEERFRLSTIEALDFIKEAEMQKGKKVDLSQYFEEKDVREFQDLEFKKQPDSRFITTLLNGGEIVANTEQQIKDLGDFLEKGFIDVVKWNINDSKVNKHDILFCENDSELRGNFIYFFRNKDQGGAKIITANTVKSILKDLNHIDLWLGWTKKLSQTDAFQRIDDLVSKFKLRGPEKTLETLSPVGKFKGEIEGEFTAFYVGVDTAGNLWQNHNGPSASKDAWVVKEGWRQIELTELQNLKDELGFLPTVNPDFRSQLAINKIFSDKQEKKNKMSI